MENQGHTAFEAGDLGTGRETGLALDTTRQASVAVMETVPSPLQFVPRPFGRTERGGSLPDAAPPLPGLKDVLNAASCNMTVPKALYNH